MADYRWKPIEKWKGPWQPSTLPEVFAEFRKHLDADSLRAFMERSAREWSIETGQIEGAFDLDRGVTTTLIEEGFNASLINPQANGLSPEHVHAILMDTKDVLNSLFDFVKGQQPLTQYYIRTLHEALMRNVNFYYVYQRDPATGEMIRGQAELQKGSYKENANNPQREDGSVHEYCPPGQARVEAEMARLIELFEEMTAEGAPPIVLSAWLHHAFTQIHPFQDGNGRVARALATLVLIKGGLPPFTVIREMKTRYIHALESADDGNPQPLLDFFESALYRQLFLISNSIRPTPPSELSPNATLDEILNAAEHRLRVQQNRGPVEWESCHALADRYSAIASGGLAIVAHKIAAAQRRLGLLGNESVGTNRLSDSLQDWGAAFWEAWGLSDEDGVSFDIEWWAHQPSAPPAAQISAYCDRSFAKKSGFVAFYVTFKHNEKEDPLPPTFFVNFKDVESPRFQSWLDERLRQAVFRWQSLLG